MTEPDIPAGWQPDPRGRHEYRYWDGTQWTDHVSDQGQVSEDPVANVTSPAAGASAATPARTDSAITPSPSSEPDLVQRSEEPVDEGTAMTPDPTPASADPEPVPAEHSREPEAVTASVPPTSRSAAPGESTTGPATRQTDARTAAQDALRSKSPEIGTVLSATVPGSGHFYMGAANAIPIGALLLVATVAALVLSYFNFVLFLVGFVIWLAAAAFALNDLRGGVQSVQSVRLPANLVGVLLIGAGALLIIALFLPFYHVKVSAGGLSISGNGSGWEVFGVEDIILLIVGLVAILAGAASLGLGPVNAADLPTWLPTAAAVGGAIGAVIVLFRMFVDSAPGLGVGTGGPDIDIGRAPGIWIALWCTLIIVLTNLGTLRALTDRSRRTSA